MAVCSHSFTESSCGVGSGKEEKTVGQDKTTMETRREKEDTRNEVKWRMSCSPLLLSVSALQLSSSE